MHNSIAVCSCQADSIGSPPQCRPECVSNSDCRLDNSCINRKCVNPCSGACGINTICRTVMHNPLCICKSGFIGDPLSQCVEEESKDYYSIMISDFFTFDLVIICLNSV